MVILFLTIAFGSKHIVKLLYHSQYIGVAHQQSKTKFIYSYASLIDQCIVEGLPPGLDLINPMHYSVAELDQILAAPLSFRYIMTKTRLPQYICNMCIFH